MGCVMVRWRLVDEIMDDGCLKMMDDEIMGGEMSLRCLIEDT